MIRRAGVAGVALLLLVTQAGTVVHGQAPTDAELRRLTEAYAQAWAKGNAKAVAALHTTESVRVGTDGRVSVGRVEIEQALMDSAERSLPGDEDRPQCRPDDARRPGRLRVGGNLPDSRRNAARRRPTEGATCTRSFA